MVRKRAQTNVFEGEEVAKNLIHEDSLEKTIPHSNTKPVIIILCVRVKGKIMVFMTAA